MMFSIILPTHKRTRPLSHAISSLLTQTYPHWELIIIDHPDSPMHTVNPIRFAQIDRRIRHVSRAYRDTHDAHAIGVSIARGDVITFLGAHDHYAPTHLAAHRDYFHTHPHVAMIHGTPTIFGSPYISDTVGTHTHVHRRVTGGTCFIREHVFDTLPAIPREFHHAEANRIRQMVHDKGFSVRTIPMPTYIYDRT